MLLPFRLRFELVIFLVASKDGTVSAHGTAPLMVMRIVQIVVPLPAMRHSNLYLQQTYDPRQFNQGLWQPVHWSPGRHSYGTSEHAFHGIVLSKVDESYPGGHPIFSLWMCRLIMGSLGLL
jgi:hypothetical protein